MHGQAADIYSFGVLIYYALHLEYPFATTDNILTAKFEDTISYNFKQMPNVYPTLYSLVDSMLASNPKSRPNWKKIIDSMQKQLAEIIKGKT